jgi:DNA-binding NarL/FixJ family response regulator
MIRILIADPDSASRQALSLLINKRLGIQEIYEAGDSEILIKTLADHPLDILLLDWRLYGAPAPETCRLLLKAYPGLKIVLLSVDAYDCQSAPNAGAGFVHKGSAPGEVLAVLEPLISSGE